MVDEHEAKTSTIVPIEAPPKYTNNSEHTNKAFESESETGYVQVVDVVPGIEGNKNNNNDAVNKEANDIKVAVVVIKDQGLSDKSSGNSYNVSSQMSSVQKTSQPKLGKAF